jgi:hypothetical protein
MDCRVAEFVRRIEPDEVLDDLIDAAKAETWFHGREHALVVLADDRIVFIRDGMDGIELDVDARLGVVLNG